MKTLAALASLVVLAACSGDAPPDRSGRPPQAVVLAQNLDLFRGDDAAIRIGFEPVAGNAFVRVAFTPESARVAVCPLAAIDAPIDGRACRSDIGAGVREPISSADMHAVAVVLRDLARAKADVRIEFDEAGRAFGARIPILPALRSRAGCSDNACNPFFELQPVHGGPFEATASWRGGRGTLLLLQGRIVGRSQTSTGVPYIEAARSSGPSPIGIGTRMSAPAEYALVLQPDPETGAVHDVKIDARWP